MAKDCTSIRWASEKEVAELIGCSLSKLRNDRLYRRGLPYSKFGSLVRYDLADVTAYLEARKIRPDGTR